MIVGALGGISAHREIAGPDGWWSELAGIGKPLDPTVVRLVGIDWLEGAASAAATDPVGEIVTTAGQADHLARELDAQRIDRLDLLCGSSFGGNVALCFAARYPERLSRLLIIGAAHRSHPMATALRSLQRRVVLLGLEHGCGPEALEIARGIAMTTYRTAEEFAGRFGTRPDVTGDFPVEAYLRHQGAQYARRNSPERFLGLSLALDLHDVDPGTVTTPTQLVAFDGDAIAPPWQMTELRDQLGGPADLVVLPSIYGHDAFLKESEAYSALLRAQLLETAR
jgi:homoserine O-acetyltransferase/O-succinyltransferase